MIHKHGPGVERYMDKTFPEHTDCQQLRELYHRTKDPEMKMGLRIAVSMAKAMQRKLAEYNPNGQKDFWDERETGK